MPSASLTRFGLLFTALLTAAACGATDPSGSPGRGSPGPSAPLTVYSGRSEELVGPLFERFEASTGIALEVRYGDSSDLALLLDEEAGRSPADVFFSQSPGAVAFLAENGRLARLDEATLEKVEPRSRGSSGRWVGVTGRQRVLVYNTSRVTPDDLPASVFDLTAPQRAARLGVAPGNSSFQDFVTAMRILEGEDKAAGWLRALHDNGARTYANNSAIVDAVARGEVDMGLVNHYYNLRALAEDPARPTRNHVFADDIGSIVIVASVSITEASERRADAAKLVEFLLGTEAQTYFKDQTFEYPLAAGVQPHQGLPPISPKLPALDLDALAGGLEKTTAMIEASGFEG